MSEVFNLQILTESLSSIHQSISDVRADVHTSTQSLRLEMSHNNESLRNAIGNETKKIEYKIEHVENHFQSKVVGLEERVEKKFGEIQVHIDAVKTDLGKRVGNLEGESTEKAVSKKMYKFLWFIVLGFITIINGIIPIIEYFKDKNENVIIQYVSDDQIGVDRKNPAWKLSLNGGLCHKKGTQNYEKTTWYMSFAEEDTCLIEKGKIVGGD